MLNGYVWIGDGKIGGLETVHRTGDMTLETEVLHGQEVVTGNVGMTDLSVSILCFLQFLHYYGQGFCASLPLYTSFTFLFI